MKSALWKTVWTMCKTVDYQWVSHSIHNVIHRGPVKKFVRKSPYVMVDGRTPILCVPYYFSRMGKYCENDPNDETGRRFSVAVFLR